MIKSKFLIKSAIMIQNNLNKSFMKSRRIKRIFGPLAIIIVVAVASYLVYIGVRLWKYYNPSYVRGLISVGFKERVSEEEIKSLVSSYNLELRSSAGLDLLNFDKEVDNDCLLRFEVEGIVHDSSVWDENSHLFLEKYEIARSQLDESPFVLYAKKTSCEVYSTDACFSMQLTDGATLEDVESLVSTVEGTSIERCSFTGGDNYIAFVIVPEGSEKKWIRKFLENEIVEYAELDYISTVF